MTSPIEMDPLSRVLTSEIPSRIIPFRYDYSQNRTLVYAAIHGENFRHIHAQGDCFDGYITLTATTSPAEIGILDASALEAGLAKLLALQLVSPFDLKPLTIQARPGLFEYATGLGRIAESAFARLNGASKEQHGQLIKDPKVESFFGMLACKSAADARA